MERPFIKKCKIMVRKYDYQDFNFLVNGKEINVRCYTTDTRTGFCHHAICGDEHTRVSYYNRTWERFKYESVLERMAEKFSKSACAEILAQIKDIAEHKRQKCEEDLARFKGLYDSLSDNAKGILARSGVEVHNEKDVQFVEGIMGAMKILGV